MSLVEVIGLKIELFYEKAIQNKEPIILRNPASTSFPWQHVLDPLFGYMLLAKNLHEYKLNFERESKSFCHCF